MTDILARLSLFSTRRKSLLALLFGAITGLGQTPFSLLWLALIGLLAGFFLFQISASIKQSAWVGWAFGTGYFGLTLSWIIEPFLVDIARHGWMAPFALIGMSAGLALFWGAAFGLAKWQGRSLALVVFLAIAELSRAYVLTGFPWGLLGYIWLDWGLDQMVAFIGPHGLTLLTLLGVWVVFNAFQHRKYLLALPLVLAAFGLMIGFGLMRTSPDPVQNPDAPIVRLIQPNAPQHQKWDPEMMPVFFGRSLGFTAAKSEQKPDLILWPETSVPYLLNRGAGALATISKAASGVPVVFGIQRSEAGKHFNSLVFMDKTGVVQDVYDKSHLVPFGEYMPGGALARWLGINGLAAADGFGFGAGDGLRLIDLGILGHALPLICYEAIFPHQVGSSTTRPDWLLQITNDAWFGELTGPQQHLAQTRFRAIEQGLPMVRAANTGISAVIDGRGVVVASLGLGIAGFIDAKLPTRLPETIYARSGDWPVIFLLLFATIALSFKSRRVSH